MELSIIVTSYKNPGLLRECLKSIEKTYDGDYEIIVADSETEDETEMMMQEFFPHIHFVSSVENIGFGELVRKGYVATKGEYVLILNSDMIMRKGAIEKLLLFLKSRPDVGLVGPKLLGFNGKWQRSCFRFYKPLTIIYRRTILGKLPSGRKHIDEFTMADFDGKSVREVDWIQGSAMMARRSSIEKVGLMDPRFRMYFEDVDWCRRFWENGLKVVYFPQSEMYHYHGRGSAGRSIILTLILNRLAWQHIFSAVKYFIKYSGKALPGNK